MKNLDGLSKNIASHFGFKKINTMVEELVNRITLKTTILNQYLKF